MCASFGMAVNVTNTMSRDSFGRVQWLVDRGFLPRLLGKRAVTTHRLGGVSTSIGVPAPVVSTYMIRLYWDSMFDGVTDPNELQNLRVYCQGILLDLMDFFKLGHVDCAICGWTVPLRETWAHGCKNNCDYCVTYQNGDSFPPGKPAHRYLRLHATHGPYLSHTASLL